MRAEDTIRAKRDYAMLTMLFDCGFRRSELVGLELDDIQTRQGHWAVVDLIGKVGHIRTVPIPNWVKTAVDQMDTSRWGLGGQNLSSSRQTGKGVGQRPLAERCLVRGQNLLRQSRLGAHFTRRQKPGR